MRLASSCADIAELYSAKSGGALLIGSLSLLDPSIFQGGVTWVGFFAGVRSLQRSVHHPPVIPFGVHVGRVPDSQSDNILLTIHNQLIQSSSDARNVQCVSPAAERREPPP